MCEIQTAGPRFRFLRLCNKAPQAEWLAQQEHIGPQSGGQKPETKVAAFEGREGSVCQAPLPVSPHSLSSVYPCVPISLWYEDTSLTGSRLTLITSFKLITSIRTLSQNTGIF